MKRTLLLLVLAGGGRAELVFYDPFPAVELRLEVQADSAGFVDRGRHDFLRDSPRAELRLDLPIGPVRLDYGIPIEHVSAGETKSWPFLDAPGPGYREQWARFGPP